MLEECWMKVYIVCTCHTICFIQHASPFIFSFDVKPKMATDMLLPVILSELVDSVNEKPRRGKTSEWIKRRRQLGSFRSIIKELIVEDRYAFKEMFRMSEKNFETVLKRVDDFISAQEIHGGYCPILSLRFKFISIWCVWFFIVIILQSVLILLNHSKFEVLAFKMMK